ncbi:MAG TPA: protease SohB [Candidatus Competibacteraceae bacterium]|nr:protease SohB [Candidatus Competibacteraceae bacterium]
MEFLSDYGLFLAKTLTVVVAMLLVVGGSLALAHRPQIGREGRLEVKDLSRRYREMGRLVEEALQPARGWRQRLAARRRARREAQPAGERRVFVLDFRGDIQASAVASLREEVSAILAVATPRDEVVLRLESPGGMVHGYGLAASQLQRFREHGIPLTVAVDKVAASGGYLMACVANRILAAPFAILGSIGVVAQLPNFHRWLRNHDIDFELHTAGPYKRTLTLFGENTEEGRRKFQEELEDVHALFKYFIAEHRPALDLARVATGEYWLGQRALELGLVDELRTSDDYLLAASREARLMLVRYRVRRSLGERLMLAGVELFSRWHA